MSIIRKTKEPPLQPCALTGNLFAKEELLKFVISPSQQLTPDVANELPGSAIWVECSQKKLCAALEEKQLQHLISTDIIVPDKLDEKVYDLMRQRCLNWLGLAKKSGILVSGKEKVDEYCKKQKASLLLKAQEHTEEKRRNRILTDKKYVVITMFSNEELSSSLGHAHVVNVALGGGAIAQHFMSDVKRLARYMDLDITSELKN